MGKVRRVVKSLALRVRPKSKEDASLIGREGYNRQIRCNNSKLNSQKFGYRGNAISTTKYTVFTFLPKSLFEQFRRLANIFFLAQAALSLVPDVTPFKPATLIGPLVLVVGVSIAKEWLEDFRRFQLDLKVNARKVKVHVGGGVFVVKRWRDLRVGDIVRVEKNSFFPADLLMISSSSSEAMCYVETMNLDGETNLKTRKAIEATVHLNHPESLRDWEASIQCEEPNPSLYTFVGNLDTGGRVHSLGPANILLRDSKLRNTLWVYGIVVFTGHDTKVMQNSTEPPSKRSRLERQMDYVIIVLFGTLVVISVISGLVYGVWLKTTVPDAWYLAPEERRTVTFDIENPAASGVALLITSLILYGYLIPISLYVSIEMVKMFQAYFVNRDMKMYYEETDTWAHARTSNLNEELGQVDTVLSDKTGTLTCNVMEFLKCSVAGTSYGRGVTEVERATAKRLGKLIKLEDVEEEEEEAAVRGDEWEEGGEGAVLRDDAQAEDRPEEEQHQWVEVFSEVDNSEEISGGLGSMIGKDGKMEPTNGSRKSKEAAAGGARQQLTMAASSMSGDGAQIGAGGEDFDTPVHDVVVGKKKKKSKGKWLTKSKKGSVQKTKKREHVKGFNLKDSRLLKGNWMKQPNAEEIRMFFRILAVCHTVVPEVDEQTKELKYEAESPDEAAFVVAAQQFGFEFRKRTPSNVQVMEPRGRVRGAEMAELRVYEVLAVLEFNSTRKRMSVIVRDPAKQLILMCKGADSVIYERLSPAGRTYADITAAHLKEYGEAGLRTLALAYRILSEEEYQSWDQMFQQAKTTVGPDRDDRVDEAAEQIEQNLILVGATGVEDKLQPGVPETIDRLAQAGLKIWVLTGDKVETAINIGYAASLLRTGMTQIVISLDTDEIKEAEEEGNKQKLFKIAIASVTEQIADGLELIREVHEGGTKPNGAGGEELVYALIIDGRALTYALDDSLKTKFLELAVGCASVICCRVSPKQKALVTMLVKEGTGNVTLGIGDGANDVGMIQAADIGVGISGVEGMQAVMASDFSIGQFRFLERLLIVHGHWCYKRIALMVSYFFYKNLAFGLTVFYFNSNTLFSGQSIYEEWAMALYNVIFTSMPVMVVGVFEQDVSADTCLKFPALYRQGPGNAFFNWGKIAMWMIHGVYNSIVLFFLVVIAFSLGAFRSDGRVADMWAVGTSMYTCIIWTVTLQLALSISYFTWVHHIFLWGSVVSWYMYLFVYGALDLNPNSLRGVLSDELAPSPMFWLVTILLPIVCVFPSFIYMGCVRQFRPADHHIIEEIVKLELQKKDPAMWKREQRKARHRSKFGITAAVDEAVRRMRSKAYRGFTGSL